MVQWQLTLILEGISMKLSPSTKLRILTFSDGHRLTIVGFPGECYFAIFRFSIVTASKPIKSEEISHRHQQLCCSQHIQSGFSDLTNTVWYFPAIWPRGGDGGVSWGRINYQPHLAVMSFPSEYYETENELLPISFSPGSPIN